MRCKLIGAAILILSITPTYGADTSPSRCEAAELYGYEPYDDLVCSGLEAMEKGDYGKAVEYLGAAMEVPLFEFPNFMLFPRLALAYHKFGDKAKAEALLKKGELSLMIYARVLHCELQPDMTFMIVKRWWNQSHKFASPYYEDVANIMCGGAYESIYSPENLEEIEGELSLVRNFLDIKKQIEEIK